MSLLSVEEALAQVLASVQAPLPVETVPLAAGLGRTLAQELAALRTQPPFRASAMDGYAVRAADCARPGVTLPVVGAAAAGGGFARPLAAGEAVRIFTGAPVPEGADSIVIQENAQAADGRVTFLSAAVPGRHIRAAGIDFSEGATLLAAGTRLDARHLALAAAMGHATLPVHRRPRVGILATGDELVRPGEPARPDQIVASNNYATAALVLSAGGEPVDLGIAPDRPEALRSALEEAKARDVEVFVTLGGASVGDHDLVQSTLSDAGMALQFWKIAMRPGKPVIHGRIGEMLVLGLPGNPVSAIVCAILFLVPLVRALQGDPRAGADPSQPATLGVDLPAGDTRQDYMRATLQPGTALPVATPLPVQDSSLLRVLAEADALVIRPPHAPPARAGDPVRIIPLRGFQDR